MVEKTSHKKYWERLGGCPSYFAKHLSKCRNIIGSCLLMGQKSLAHLALTVKVKNEPPFLTTIEKA